MFTNTRKFLALGASLALLPCLVGAATIAGLSPVEMRGLWFPKTEASIAKCAHFLSRDPVAPGSDALVVSERQMVWWAEHGPVDVVFLTDVRPRRKAVWRIQGLLDSAPYEAPKTLETYVVEVRNDELLWSQRRSDAQLAETVATTVYLRCGY